MDDVLGVLKSLYPKRDGGQGWGAVTRLIDRAVAGGADMERVMLGTKNYATHCRRKGMLGTEFVMQARTFYGRDQHWEEWADQDMRSAAEIAADRAREALVQRAARISFRPPNPGEPDFRYEQALSEAERQAAPRGEPKRFGVVA